ncbi:MAG: NADH-quinone oxidoreductase subunit C [Dehalococcoidia bacterium]|nr:NADH-quinone oxidoreductase subunit C [Dehalococcoidia bacterium]
MIEGFSTARLAEAVGRRFPNAVVETTETALYLQADSFREVAAFLKDAPGLEFDFLVAVTAVDYVDYFEMVYHLMSIAKSHAAVVKVKLFGRDDPVIPSVTPVWKGANYQEREVYDLMGIHFEGHPNLKRIFLWDEFPGYPLRKDFWYQNPSIGERWYQTTQEDATQD